MRAAAALAAVAALAGAAAAAAAQPGPAATARTFAQRLFLQRNVAAVRPMLGDPANGYVVAFWRTTWAPNGAYRNLLRVGGTRECSGRTTVTMTRKQACIRFHVLAFRTDKRRLVEETKATLLVTTAEEASSPWRVVDVDYRAEQEVVCTAAEYAKHSPRCKSSLPFPN
jgi:hypothetical protein